MKRLKLITVLPTVLILVLIAKDAGTFLVINEPPQKADVIIVLSGDRGARLQRGIDLYRQGYAPYLLYTSSVTNLEKSEAIAEGVPRDAFILDRQAQNTYQNAVYSKALMEKYGLHSAIVVSSDYHMRRASLIFAHVFRGTGTTFTYVSVKAPEFHPTRWWTSRQTMLQMCYQYAGIAVFYLGLGLYITNAWIFKWPFWYLFRYMH
ncbi:MAG TPA: YdcF family protein [Spirochaetia bacterium]|nr:YdcF family protein [Spirochaetia bacterium]